jgi:hypothetical protein
MGTLQLTSLSSLVAIPTTFIRASAVASRLRYPQVL